MDGLVSLLSDRAATKTTCPLPNGSDADLSTWLLLNTNQDLSRVKYGTSVTAGEVVTQGRVGMRSPQEPKVTEMAFPFPSNCCKTVQLSD